jgi:hypothetical protein
VISPLCCASDISHRLCVGTEISILKKLMYSSLKSGALSSQAQRGGGEQSPRHPKFRGCRSVCIPVGLLCYVAYSITYSADNGGYTGGLCCITHYYCCCFCHSAPSPVSSGPCSHGPSLCPIITLSRRTITPSPRAYRVAVQLSSCPTCPPHPCAAAAAARWCCLQTALSACVGPTPALSQEQQFKKVAKGMCDCLLCAAA